MPGQLEGVLKSGIAVIREPGDHLRDILRPEVVEPAAIDQFGDLYVSDWGNDRVQKFTADGQHLLSMGRTGSGDGALKRPAGVAVDAHGHSYGADRCTPQVGMLATAARPG